MQVHLHCIWAQGTQKIWLLKAGDPLIAGLTVYKRNCPVLTHHKYPFLSGAVTFGNKIKSVGLVARNPHANCLDLDHTVLFAIPIIKYSQTSMARTPMGPRKLIRDRGSSSQ